MTPNDPRAKRRGAMLGQENTQTRVRCNDWLGREPKTQPFESNQCQGFLIYSAVLVVQGWDMREPGFW